MRTRTGAEILQLIHFPLTKHTWRGRNAHVKRSAHPFFCALRVSACARRNLDHDVISGEGMVISSLFRQNPHVKSTECFNPQYLICFHSAYKMYLMCFALRCSWFRKTCASVYVTAVSFRPTASIFLGTFCTVHRLRHWPNIKTPFVSPWSCWLWWC